MRALPLVALSLLLPAGSAAASAERSGPVLAARVGWGIPSGDVARGGPALSDVVERTIPVGLDLGYRLNARVWGVAQLGLATGTAARPLCADGASCSVWDARFAVAIQLRLAPGARLDPWVGVGVGIEALYVEGVDAGGTRSELSWAGFELPHLEAGLDLAIGDRVGIGPYVSYTIARFTTASTERSGEPSTSGSVKERATHGWLAGGLKVTLHL